MANAKTQNVNSFSYGLSLYVTTFSVVLFEIALTRVFGYVFSYHFTALAVSLAILGLGFGAYGRIRLLTGFEQAKLVFSVHLLTAFSFVLFDVALCLSHNAIVLIVASMFPFLLTGICISHYYEMFSASRANQAYALDLFGAATACFSLGWLLSHFNFEGLLLVLFSVSIVLAQISGRRVWPDKKFQLMFGALPLWILVVLAGAYKTKLPDPLLNGKTSLEKPLARSIHLDGGRVADHAWSSIGRADLYEQPSFSNVKWIYNDATNSTVMLKWTQDSARLDARKGLFAFFPYEIGCPKKVLIIGSGAGLEVNLAKLGQAAQIDAVEINPAIIRLVRRWKDFAGPVYEQSGVRLFIEEGRRFISSNRESYDLIQMSLVLTATAQSGTYALAEGYLYTKEAFRSYLQSLSDSGFLVVIDDSFDRTLRNIMTTLAVLRENLNQSDKVLMQNFAVLLNPQTEETGYKYLLLVSRNPITGETSKQIQDQASKRGFKILWLSGVAAEPPFGFLLDQGSARFMASYPLKLDPPTDDSPFFFNFSKGARPTWNLLRPYVILILIVGTALIGMLWQGTGLPQFPEQRRASYLAILFGVGFMFIELGLLQKLTLAVGGPTQVLSVLLFAVLFYCGVGSFLSDWLLRLCGWRAGHFALLVCGVNLLTSLMISKFYLLNGFSSEPNRIACVVLMVAPIGLVLGMPFPNLLKEKTSNSRRISYLWAVNGLGSVLGATLFLVLVLQLGIQSMLYAGSCIYFFAWLFDNHAMIFPRCLGGNSSP